MRSWLKDNQELRGVIAYHVDVGILSQAQIVELVLEIFAADMPQKRLRSLAEQLTARAIRAHARRQKKWPQVTDCDRLDQAFAELESTGIMCRQYATLRRDCGFDAIWQEINAQTDLGHQVRGYCFYTAQDTVIWMDGQGLYLHFDTAPDADEEKAQIGREIMAALQRHGLRTTWDGYDFMPILVELNWQRRRQTVSSKKAVSDRGEKPFYNFMLHGRHSRSKAVPDRWSRGI